MSYLAALGLLWPVSREEGGDAWLLPACLTGVVKASTISQRIDSSKEDPAWVKYFNTSAVIIAVIFENHEG